jgi:hypothetical protein
MADMGKLVDVDYNPFEVEPKGKLVDVDYNPLEKSTPVAGDRAKRLSTANPSLEMDDESWEEVKGIDYLKQKGVDVTASNADQWKESMYGAGQSWGGVNNMVSSAISVEPQGPKKSVAKISPKQYGKLWLQGVAKTSTSVAGGFMAFQKWSDEMQMTIARQIDPSIEARAPIVEKKRQQAGALEDIASTESTVEDFYTADMTEEQKGRLSAQFAEGLGQLPEMALMATPAMPLAVVSVISRSIDEGYDEAIASGKSEEESLNISIGYGLTSGIIEAAVDKLTVGLGGDVVRLGKQPVEELAKKLAVTFGKSQALAGAEGGTEVMQHVALKLLTDQDISPKEAMRDGFLGWAISTVAGPIFGSVNIARSGKIKKQLRGMGMTEDQASTVVVRLARAENDAEANAIVDEAMNVVFAGIGERVMKLEKGAPSRDVTGLNGGPLDPADLAILREQPELMEGLDQSEEADLLKKAVLENDLGALAEYNQRLVGAQEVSDLTINGEAVPVAEEAPVAEDSAPAKTVIATVNISGGSYEVSVDAVQDEDGTWTSIVTRPFVTVDGNVQVVTDQATGIASKEEALKIANETLHRQLSLQSKSQKVAADKHGQAGRSALAKASEAASKIYDSILGKIEQAPAQEAPKVAEAPVVVDESPVVEPESELEIITEPTVTGGLSDIVGASRKWNNAFHAELGRGSLSQAERITNVETVQKAMDDITVNDDAEGIAKLILDPESKKKQASTDEIARMLVKKSDIANQIEKKNAELAEVVKGGNDVLIQETAEELDALVGRAVNLTEAMRRAGSENARALQAMAMTMDRRSFDLVSVMAEATRTKGEKLTAEESKGLKKLTDELAQVEKDALGFMEEIYKLEEQMALEQAQVALEQELSSTRSKAKKGENEKMRNDAKENLRQLGRQVNDVTSLPPAFAIELSRIAVSHIRDGAATIEEVVSRVQADVSDVSAKNIYDALGGRVKQDVKKVKSEVKDRITELKKQAKLYGEIEDAMNGMVSPSRTAPPSSKEVKDLRYNLKALASSVVQSERDSVRVDQILDRISEIDSMIENQHREVKIKHLKSEDLKEAEKMLKVANAELSAKDRNHMLKEILSTGRKTKPKAEQTETTQRLEELRAENAVLEELIKLQEKESAEYKKEAKKKRDEAKERAFKKREEAMQERVDKLSEQIELLYRDMATEKAETRKTGLEQTEAQLKEGIRDQDTIFDLLETIRNRKVKERPMDDKAPKADPYGYKASIKALREDIRNSEWYAEWKQNKHEAEKLIIVKGEIAQMEKDIKAGNLDPYITTTQKRIVKSDELIRAELRKHQLKKEINSRIRNLQQRTAMGLARLVWDIPRTLKLTLDVGHIFRQGGIVLRNPAHAIKFMKQSLDALFSEDKANALDLQVLKSKHYELAKISGLHLIEEGMELDGREAVLMNGLMSNWVGVKQSGRTQITSLNVLRMDIFSSYMDAHPQATAQDAKDFAWAINIMTGYGQGKVASGAVQMGADWALTSTRFTVSRFQAFGLMTPLGLLHPTVRNNKALKKQLTKTAVRFWGTKVLLGYLASLAWPDDVEMGWNPNHSTFLKIVVDQGNGFYRVYDPLAGVQQALGTFISVTSALAGLSSKEPLVEFLKDISKKQAPSWSFVTSITQGKKYPNEEISRWEALARGLSPIIIEGIYDAIQEDTPLGHAIMGTALDATGIGSYTVPYDKLDDKTGWYDQDFFKVDDSSLFPN